MLPPTYQMLPWLTPWVDTRGWGGSTAASGVTWNNGVWASWPEALRSGYALSANPPWGASTTWTRFASGLRAPGTGQITIPSTYAGAQGLAYTSSYMRDTGMICPSRSLRNDPTPVDIVDGGVAVTLGGVGYRNTYARRRQWVVDLLLDGPLDTAASGGASANADARTLWQAFLARADLGVTLYLYGANWTISGTLGSNWAYPGTPNRICGALADATNVRWNPPKTGILARYEVTITITETTPPGAT